MKIPCSSISRLSLYYRSLLSVKGEDFVSSHQLSEVTGCGAAQIRRDLAYFGQFGTRGRGYHAKALRDELKKILGIDRHWDVALIGIGNLGSALLAYKGFRSQGFNIKCAFDNDKKKIGKNRQGLKIKDIKDLKEEVRSNNINIAIVTVPQHAAHEVIDKVISAGINAILNFAPIRPKVPPGIELLNIDLSMELEKLTYFLQKDRR